MKTIHLFTIILILSATKIVKSQVINTPVKSIYQGKCNDKLNNDVTLILYTNGEYLNFGLYNNPEEEDSYIWFSAGNYTLTDSCITLKSDYSNSINSNIRNEIKYRYKKRSDFTMINSYYEFVTERFREKKLHFKNEHYVDSLKSFIYHQSNLQ